jgi:hypothetical protein
MVKQHEGLILVQSRVGEGSIFSVYLPALTVRGEENRDVVDSALPSASSNGRILFIGAGEGLASEISSTLDKVGIQLQTVMTLEQAKQRLTSKSAGVSTFIVNIDRLDPEPLPVELDELINNALRDQPYSKPLLITRSLEKFGGRMKASEKVELVEPVNVTAAMERMIRRLLRSADKRQPEKSDKKGEGTHG